MIPTLGCGDSFANDGDVFVGCAAACRPGDVEVARYGGGGVTIGRDGQILMKDGTDVVTVDGTLHATSRVSVGSGFLIADPAGNLALIDDDRVSFRDTSYGEVWSTTVGAQDHFETSPHRLFVIPFEDGEIRALRTDTGGAAWTRAQVGRSALAGTADDGAIIGEKAGELGSIRRLDASGAPVWTLALQATITNLAMSPTGDVAVVGNFAGSSLDVGGISIPAAPPAQYPRPTDRSQFLGMLDGPTGVVRWVRTIGVTKDQILALVPLAADVIVAGSYDNGPLGFAPLGLSPAAQGFVVRLTRTSLAWAHVVSGGGDQGAGIVGLVGDSLLVDAWTSGRAAEADYPSFLEYGDLRFEVEGSGHMFMRVRE